MPPELRTLAVSPLASETFQTFGHVLDASRPADEIVNDGGAHVFRDLALADFEADGGRVRFNVVRAAPATFPLRIALMERHPLSSQLFSPLAGTEWLVVVAPTGPFNPDALVAFRARPDQAVSYARGVWHAPLLALHRPMDFLVVDRAGPGANLDLERVDPPRLIAAP